MRSLRIAHIADTHLGYKSNTLPARDEDFMNSWMYACRAIVDSSPDIIIHAGDVFHNARPDWKAITGYTDGIKILLEANCPLFVIAGNHDTTSIHLHHTVFSFTTNIIPQVVATNDTLPTVHHLDDLFADVVLVPHKALLDRSLPGHIQDITETLDPERYWILVAHGSISKEDLGTELGAIDIPHAITDHNWDYIALGHLHIQQPYGSRGWYSGSTERCGWSDHAANPAWTLVTLNPDKTFTHFQQFVPHMPMIQLPEIDGTNQADDDIVYEVLESVSQVFIPDERSNLRVKVTHIPSSRKRMLLGSIQRALKKGRPNLVVTIVMDADKDLVFARGLDSPMEVHKGIMDHFRDFVATEVDEDFRETFLTRGIAALEKAAEDE